MGETPRFDPAKIVEGLSLFDWSGEVCYEMRVLGRRDVPGSPWFMTAAGYFNDPKAFARAAGFYSGWAQGVYVVLNPAPRRLLWRCENRLDPRANSATKDDEIAERRWIFVDLDTSQPKGTMTNEAEHNEALDRGREVFEYLKPRAPGRLVLADSGNGCHVLMEDRRPNDEAGKARVRGVLSHLAQKFTGGGIRVDPCTYNAARLGRVFGTLTCKGDPHPVENPFRIAQIMEQSNGG